MPPSRPWPPMNDLVQRLARLGRTAVHLRPEQVALWPVNQLRRRLLGVEGAVQRAPLRVLGRLLGEPSEPVLRALADTTRAMLPMDAEAAERARCLARGRVEHLGVADDLGWPPDWGRLRHGLLWAYHVNYLEELPWLAMLAAREGDGALLRVLQAWTDGCPPGARPGWEPYPTALRLLSLARAASLLPPGAARTQVLEAVAAQSVWLLERLEVHVGANHLLANLLALSLAAAVLPRHPVLRLAGPPMWRWLAAEADAQVLPDGGHYERSPMYHAWVTATLCEAATVLGHAGRAPGRLAAAAVRAVRFQETLRHPGGALPYFNDAAGREPHAPAFARAFAASRLAPGTPLAWPGRLVRLQPTGLVVLRAPERHLVMDCGPIGPDHQPGHAHADALSFELSAGAHRVVVNAGVRGYADDPLRAWSRSTAAHSTVQIGDADQIELWAAFRVGRRAAARVVEAGEGDGAVHVTGEVRWPTLPGEPVHRRRVVLGDGGDVLVLDTVHGAAGLPVTSRLHLHPDVHAAIVEPGCARLVLPGGAALLLTAAGATLALERAPWFPDFGVTREGWVAVLRASGDGVAHIAAGIAAGARVGPTAGGASLGPLDARWP